MNKEFQNVTVFPYCPIVMKTLVLQGLYSFNSNTGKKTGFSN
jgi:hypothetical protein